MIFRLLALLAALPVIGWAQPAPVHRLTLQEYEATLVHWRSQHPDTFTFERRALCSGFLPIYLLRITDRSVPDADKQICLVTSLHGGPERSGCTAAMALAEWLLSNDAEAIETRRRQIVLIMPIANPVAFFHTDRFRNANGIDPYTGIGRISKLWDASRLTFKAPDDSPEISAVLSVIDEYQPEVHADLHGTGMQEYLPDQLGDRRMRQGHIMTEVTGSAYSNYALRPWDWRVTESMISAGCEAGFPSDRFEADAQRTFWGPDLAPLGKKLWSGQPLFYTAHYGYAKYHTMMTALEVAWEQSAIARMRGLFRIGNRPWGEERLAGYPVDRMKSFIGHFVTTYGNTATARRKSRAELWSRQHTFSLGILYPQWDGRASLVCTTSAAALAAMNDPSRERRHAALQERLGEDAAAIEQFLAQGSEIKVAMDTPASPPEKGNGAEAPLQHGIGFRLRLPYRAPVIKEVRLNGRRLSESASDGYQSWTAEGAMQLQIHVPPARAAATDLYFITCDYTPESSRRIGWLPPAEVREISQAARADALPPERVDVPYGPHFRQTLDFWHPASNAPAPLVLYIHGGGWSAEDKTNIHQHLDVRRLLDAGIAVAAINYRFILDADAAGIFPPVEAPLSDAKLALQFLRAKAPEWMVDATRIAATGVSAGGCSALWLALHEDMAEAESPDAISRHSTRLIAVAAKAPQTTLNPKLMLEWMPGSTYGGHAFGFQKPGMTRADAFAPFLAAHQPLLPLIRKYSPLDHASADDPPVFLTFAPQEKPPVKGMREKDPNHSVLYGVMLQEKLQPLGVPIELSYLGGPNTDFADIEAFLIAKLKQSKNQP